MTAHTRIAAAENAIATAYTNASWRDGDHTHEAAVELESRGLLVDRAAQEREFRARLLAEIDASIKAHEAEHPFAHLLFRQGMREVRMLVAGGVVVDGSPGDLFDPTDPAGDAS